MKKKLSSTILFMLLSVFFVNAQNKSTLWSEDFEGDWTSNWYVDMGTWEVGIPTSGPGTAFNGNNCAATVLDGNYSESVNTRLIRFNSFVVPDADENPRLRFWQWYSFSDSDKGFVQIKVADGEWETCSPEYTSTSSGVWTHSSIDLSDYAGSSVQIAFYFESRTGGNYPYTHVSSGWYIDNLSMETGPIIFNNPETWETGLGDWFAERGTWEVGTPSGGPGSSYSGENCAGTVLNGDYHENVDSRLISPQFVVPAADDNPRLRFWQWYSFSDSDKGFVQIKVEDGEWETCSPDYTSTSSGVWTHSSLDLSDYAGSSVQIAFYFQSRTGGNYPYTHVSSGWYIDNLSMETGPIIFNNPETWETGLGDWFAERGTWEVGTPSGGPGSSYSGENCAGTVLNGDYHENVDSRLISPQFVVPAADDNPRLRFWQWYSFSDSDKGFVQIKVEDGEWETCSPDYTSTSSGVWTHSSLDLSDYAGSSVQIAFYFQSRTGGNYPYTHVSSGWYVDDLALITGPIIFNNPETWETGLGDWFTERGTWEVGTPSGGPGSSYSGENCAGTVLDGNYHENVDSRLISPQFVVPAADDNPRLRFWQWYSFSDSDKGFVQIKVEDGEWETCSLEYTNTSSGVWTYSFVNLSDYADSLVQIAFYFQSRTGGNYPYTHVSSGWYIDDLIIEDNSNLSVDAGPDVTISSGSSATFIATVSGGTQPYFIEWTPAESLDDPTLLSPVASPSDSTTYTLKVTDDNGCFRTDKVTVFVEFTANDETDILTYSFSEQSGVTIINSDSHTVDVDVVAGTDVTALISSFSLSYGATVKVGGIAQASGVTSNDFTNPVTYSVTAEDGITVQDWVVTVTVKVATDDETDILTFGFGIPPQTGEATIMPELHTVDIEVEEGTDLTNLVASFKLSEGASAKVGDVTQESGISANDFTAPVAYFITAGDGVTIQDWVITVNPATGIRGACNSEFQYLP